MITIYLNEEPQEIEPSKTIYDLLEHQQFIGQHFALALNNKLITNAAYKSIQLQTGDRVDIIVPMQGG